MHFLHTLLPFMPVSFAAAAVLPFDHTNLVAKDVFGRQTLTASMVVANIQTVTTLSYSLKLTINSAASVNSYTEVFTLAQNIASDFDGICTALTMDVTAMNGVTFTDATSCQTIGNALTQFVMVHHDVLQALIFQSPVFTNWGCAAPILAVLETLETEIDSFAYAAIQMLPSQTLAIQQGQNMLDNDCSSAKTKFSLTCLLGLCLPEETADGGDAV
ncbi:hypothetical protein DACRYDRAFT_19695 [Dacryopinax primogenitus]|uniref:Uncharacterized protein n=1 Tax=Dacryopinax primogenitus (strain DJM 731) TaxID=1858805 RepID=M5GFV9_DACPD|nr:uncharacterized protein DACRYDRAFT_19695 [Dacryopinax primogenitus]EJU06622.1 hypothetical protein DACRYDRAFT_19695 [Dacryopinax primogenitus]